MDILAKLQATAQQQNAMAVKDGRALDVRSTRVGQLFTLDWKSELVLAGYAFNITVGGITAGADVSLITGGGNGTTINSDRPEMAVGTPTGYYHIPLSFRCAVQQDMDADTEESNIILFGDLTQQIALPIAAGCTVETPQNLLDGGPSSVSYAASAYHTSDITDPACTVLLAYSTCQAAQVTAAGTIAAVNKCVFEPDFPHIFKGPCSVVACWGGTSAATAAATYCWAEVPIARYE